ncbi:hypothetical protein INR49_018956, partial [Caranx melampygus]
MIHPRGEHKTSLHLQRNAEHEASDGDVKGVPAVIFATAAAASILGRCHCRCPVSNLPVRLLPGGRARAASRLAGLFASRLSALFLPRLRSSWIMVFFTYILSISLQEPPLEFSKPLRLFGSGGRPSIQAIPPTVPFVDLPFIVLNKVFSPLSLQTLWTSNHGQRRHVKLGVMMSRVFRWLWPPGGCWSDGGKTTGDPSVIQTRANRE